MDNCYRSSRGPSLPAGLFNGPGVSLWVRVRRVVVSPERNAYLKIMPEFEFCITTVGKIVPAGADLSV